jgi:hypothetical protein
MVVYAAFIELGVVVPVITVIIGILTPLVLI